MSDAPQSRLDSALSRSLTTTSSGLDFLIQQTILGKDPAACYEAKLIRIAATARGSDLRAAVARLKTAFGKDFSQTRFIADVKEAKLDLESQADSPEPSGLLRGNNGSVLLGYENATIFLQSSPQWEGVLGYNDFTGGIELRKQPPPPVRIAPGSEIDDVFDTQVTRWMERTAGLLFKRDVVHHSVDALARENTYHPVREYLERLPEHDGRPRIAEWLITYCGAAPGSDENPNHYVRAVGMRFLVSMIARILQPGCKADHMLVLEGKTGIGKSSIARALVPDENWFTDEIGDMSGQDSSMKVRGIWLAEMAELDALSRADEKTAKKFISQQYERFRMPYGRRVIKFPRQCVFIGTTEKSDWMKSETGRRFWPVLVTRMDVDALVRDRDQIWAEALKMYHAGEKWHLQGDEVKEAASAQSDRMADDIWSERVVKAVDSISMSQDWFTAAMVLDQMEIPTWQQNDISRNRLGVILRRAGWESNRQKRINGSNPKWIWERKKEDG